MPRGIPKNKPTEEAELEVDEKAELNKLDEQAEQLKEPTIQEMLLEIESYLNRMQDLAEQIINKIQ